VSTRTEVLTTRQSDILLEGVKLYRKDFHSKGNYKTAVEQDIDLLEQLLTRVESVTIAER
jgi:hypothetical protein